MQPCRRLVLVVMLIGSGLAWAEDESTAPDCPVQRPAVMFNRWQEDWSVLSQACARQSTLDQFKYIPLGGDPSNYLSLGGNLRERFERNTTLFGIGEAANSYLIQRLELHADARLDEGWQAFVQIEDARSYGKLNPTPVDRDPVDLEQAFVTHVGRLGDGTLKVRVGRQEMAFDLQRFVAVRDGPNVRQAFDALWADYEIGMWRLMAYATQPVQYRDASDFDDRSSRDETFNGLRVERKQVLGGDLSGYWSRLYRLHAQYLDGSGPEHRDVLDLRHTGTFERMDWDLETMLQTGSVGAKAIRAWALGSILGFEMNAPWNPRAAIQVDAASGDRKPDDGRIGTFNPLFPNGYYFTLAGYTSDSNLLHLKPSVTLKPRSDLTLLGAVGLQWRESTADAIYQQGNVTVPNTAGRGGRWTGMYTQSRADWTIQRNLVGSVEWVYFRVGEALRQAGGRNVDYLGVEMKFGW